MTTDMHTLDPFKWIADPYEHITRLQGGGYLSACRLVIRLPELADSKRRMVHHNGVSLDPEGTLRICFDWPFDGTSGPSIDTANNIIASLVHDALYSLLDQVKKGARAFRAKADAALAAIMKAQTVKESGRWYDPRWRARNAGRTVRRWYHWGAVRALGWLFAVLVLVVSGCIRVTIQGDWVHRGQHVVLSTNACPDTVNIDNLQEGGNADIESHITGAKLK